MVLQKCVPENGIDNAIRRQGSVLSLSGMSQTSSSSFKVLVGDHMILTALNHMVSCVCILCVGGA